MWIKFSDNLMLRYDAITGIYEEPPSENGDIYTEVACGNMKYIVKGTMKELLITILEQREKYDKVREEGSRQDSG